MKTRAEDSRIQDRRGKNSDRIQYLIKKNNLRGKREKKTGMFVKHARPNKKRKDQCDPQ